VRKSFWPLACAGVLLASSFLPAGNAGQTSDTYLVVEASKSDTRAAERGAERYPAGSRLVLVSRNGRHPIAKNFFAAADPVLSFDAKRFMFAGRENARSPWRIYEMELSGGPAKAVTDGAGDCIRPVYLPDSTAYARRTPSGFQIELLQGGSVNRLTYAPGNWLPSGVLEDGRILLDGPHALGRDIYTLYSDGSGIETVRCDHPGARRNARQVETGDIVFETARGFGRFTSALASAVPASGSALVAVVPRPVPNRHPSGLHEKDGANLLCLSVYTSKLNITDGTASRVRVYSNTAVLGEAPVETDGSFYVHVPADTPLRFEVLDTAGRVLAAQKSWIWQRRGEQRVCVGCHAGPERAPENAVPKILLRDTTPVNLTGGHS
jgi:hypothetical protein